jgi:hypothetical protein
MDLQVRPGLGQRPRRGELAGSREIEDFQLQNANVKFAIVNLQFAIEPSATCHS